MSKEIALFGGGSQLDMERLDYIKYQGIVDMDALYKMVAQWYRDRKYDFYEQLYKDKPPELELEWVATKKVNSFYLFKVRMYFHFYDVEDIEVIKDGEKKMMAKTRVWIEIEPSLVIDWQNNWAGTSFKEKLFEFYTTKIIKREMQLKYADPLWYIYYQLHNKIKEFLGMETASNAY
jgi:hypothetical protein